MTDINIYFNRGLLILILFYPRRRLYNHPQFPGESFNKFFFAGEGFAPGNLKPPGSLFFRSSPSFFTFSRPKAIFVWVKSLTFRLEHHKRGGPKSAYTLVKTLNETTRIFVPSMLFPWFLV